jgi:DNA-binding response OmpR family regulator
VLRLACGKILVVDDDAKILKIVKHCLEKEGFLVATAADGESALTMAKQVQPDLVVLDLMLPKLNGLDVCKILNTQFNVPIIILSARGDELDRIVGLRLGVDDYLTKPFSPTELVLRVQAVMRRVQGWRRNQASQVLEYGGLMIDLGTRTVTVDCRPVNLTSKEFELLWLLVSNPQQVFTRMQLLNKVWYSDYQGDENTVTVHIRRLREKIEPNPSNPHYIRTVWGVGYKFTSD